MMLRFLGIGALTALLVTGGCSAPADGPTTPAATPVASLTTFFPTRTGPWETIQPAAIGWDTTALRSALDWAGTQRSTAVVVLWRGRIVAERYWRGWNVGTDSIIASAGKSVLSTLIGQLSATGRLTLDDPVTRWLGAGWSRSPATEARITVRDLLSMTSGLNDSLQLVAQPGNRFYYNNPAYYQLFQVAQRASGQEINSASRALLFDAIGMSSTWRLSFDTGEPGFILSATARDMARFGLLALSRGRWNGTAVVSDSTWFDRSWRAAPPDNAGYGYLWWLNSGASYRSPGPYLLPTVQAPLMPSAPRDLVAALGKGDKKIYVIPSLQVVVVRHGEEADAAGGNPLAISAFDEQWWQRLKVAMRY
jgi:CubicO group peptidase (beta-lactamase class C family)